MIGGIARVGRRIAVLAIDGYRLLLSPLIGPVCRYQPTCSAFAREAVLTHGVIRGGLLAVRRVLRCHPWAASGYDPVPARDGVHRHSPVCDVHHR
ncbi:MAG: membrane protein insertion efficiency factor YidD [Rhodospirillaceae bacterium]|nr:membrane protein insertion efficiency factor YidD [Rhodospirillaceae bacterium]